MKSAFFAVTLFVFGLLFTGSIQAAPVSTTVQGTVSIADVNNPFGLIVGDTVTAIATYDNSIIPNTDIFILEIDSVSNPLLTLTITLGSYIFQETDDIDFGFGEPALVFFNGLLSSIDFFHDFFAFENFPDLQAGLTNIDGFFIDDFQQSVTLLEGTWDFANAQTSPIPTPGVLLLILGGLIGLRQYGAQTRY